MWPLPNLPPHLVLLVFVFINVSLSHGPEPDHMKTCGEQSHVPN